MDISGFPMPDVNAIGTVHTVMHALNGLQIIVFFFDLPFLF